MSQQSACTLSLRKLRRWQHSSPLSSAKPSWLKLSSWRMLTNSSTSVWYSSQNARAPERSEEGLILPVSHSEAWNPVFGCDVAAYNGHGLPSGGTIDSALRLRNVASASSHWKDVGGWTAAPPQPHYHTGAAPPKQSFIGLAMLRDVLRVDRSGTSSYPHRFARARAGCHGTQGRPGNSLWTANIRSCHIEKWLNESLLWIRSGQTSRWRLRAWFG